MPYTTFSDVQALVGDVIKTRHFSVTTRPTHDEVESWIDQIQSEIQLRLYSYGFISRGEEIATTNMSYYWVKRIASVGVSARILQSLPAQAILSPDLEDTAQNRAVNFDQRISSWINKDSKPRTPNHGSLVFFPKAAIWFCQQVRQAILPPTPVRSSRT